MSSIIFKLFLFFLKAGSLVRCCTLVMQHGDGEWHNKQSALSTRNENPRWSSCRDRRLPVGWSGIGVRRERETRTGKRETATGGL